MIYNTLWDTFFIPLVGVTGRAITYKYIIMQVPNGTVVGLTLRSLFAGVVTVVTPIDFMFEEDLHQ